MNTASEFVPVLPGGRSRHGVDWAETRRLVELRSRYRALLADPATPPTLRAYARELLAEIGAELRRRSPKAAAS